MNQGRKNRRVVRGAWTSGWLCAWAWVWAWTCLWVQTGPVRGQGIAEWQVPVAGQPLAGNVSRVLQALEFLGAPLPSDRTSALEAAVKNQDAEALQRALDPLVLLVVTLNPESRVKVQRGPGRAALQQAGYTPMLIKVINQSTVTEALQVRSPQAGPVYAGMSSLSAERMQRGHLKETAVKSADPQRFLELSLFGLAPMTPNLSGLLAEYAILLVYSRDAGKREAVLGFDVGQGSQDLGFRAEAPVLFDIRPAVEVTLRVKDHDGKPAVGRFTFRDAARHVYPPQAKRLAPDFYFQPQVYRRDGEAVLLPPGKLRMEYGRGPEYRRRERDVVIPREPKSNLEVTLERWIEPAEHGFFSGDHHIHGAGCAHYTSPTEGVTPEDMFAQIGGEGLNVGCVLTWGPCFDYQRRFFAPSVHKLSEPFTVMKYDLEISGFGSEALGHVCLLNLRDQSFPGSEGTKVKGWPRWTTPVLRWAKAQGGVTGYAHSGSGLGINAKAATQRLFGTFDTNRDALLIPAECAEALLPLAFADVDRDGDGALTEAELAAAHERAAEQLPNLAIPEMNSVGAMETPVSVALGVCDFISAMNTPRTAEWNMWYHLLNCGFPLKVSGETDFPCMSGDRVGQGRVYAHLGKVGRIEFEDWCRALAQGRSYVSDGFAHVLEFTVNDVAPGYGKVTLASPGTVVVRAQVAFAPETPRTVAQGTLTTPGGKTWIGDTVTLHGPRTEEVTTGGQRLVELVMNGRAVASREVPADGAKHALQFELEVKSSAWVALRQFPQMHSNPVDVLVGGKSIRASRSSARWCIEAIEQLWRNRGRSIPETERVEARRAFDEAIAIYRRVGAEAE